MEKSHIYYLEYLDKILMFLQNHPQGKAKYSQLTKHFLGKEYDSNEDAMDKIPVDAFGNFNDNEDFISVDWSQSEYYQKTIFDSALHYLMNLKLIMLIEQELFITFEGHMKIANSFVSEHEKEHLDKSIRRDNTQLSTTVLEIQKYTLPITIFLSVVAITISIIALCVTYNKEADHDSNQGQQNGNNAPYKTNNDTFKIEDSVKKFSHDSTEIKKPS